MDLLPARKLAHCLSLSSVERVALGRALALDVRSVRQRTKLVEAGEPAAKLAIMLAGWARRYKQLADGRRQIVAFYVPGDICDFSIFMAPVLDSTIELLAGAKVAGLSRGQLGSFAHSQPRVARAFWWDLQRADSIQREWMVNVTCRSARERIAHLLCEIVMRLEAVGLCQDKRCDVPITQSDLAEACGMTTAHANRTLRELRDEGLASWRQGHLSVTDWDGLRGMAGFDPAYLQLGGRRGNPAALNSHAPSRGAPAPLSASVLVHG